MPIPDLPLFKHRDTVVTPADQNQFVTQFETTMDTMSNDVIPAMNDAITDINTKTVTATTARDEAVSAKNIAVSAKDEALTAVATLQEGTIDDTIIAPNKTFSNQYTNNNFVKLTKNQTIAGIKTFTSSPIIPTPTEGTQAVNKIYVDTATDRIGLFDYGYEAKPYHIVAFGGEFNRADFPKLWAYLQTYPTLVKTQTQWQTEATANGGICGFFSSGNGTTTFRVPNLDKAFLRPDSRGVGSYQADEFKEHNHAGMSGTSGATTTGAYYPVAIYGFTGATGGPETRPKNIAILPLIVAK